MDVALLATLRDGLLLRRAEAAALTWGDVEFRDDGPAMITLRRSKTDQENEGVVLYIGRGSRTGPTGYQARTGVAAPGHFSLWNDYPQLWKRMSQRRRQASAKDSPATAALWEWPRIL